MERIFQTPVPPHFPKTGPICLILYGEAPGPLGADKSGIPFWGDRAGKCLYRAMEQAGLATVPPEAFDNWDGTILKKMQLFPILHGVVLSNAYPTCPTQDGQHFRSPTNKELGSPENRSRVQQELEQAMARCPVMWNDLITPQSLKQTGMLFQYPSSLASGWNKPPLPPGSTATCKRLKVIAMGKRAEWLLRQFEESLNFDFFTLPHPSAQGLLQAAPNKGKGMKLSDLQIAWENNLAELLSN